MGKLLKIWYYIIVIKNYLLNFTIMLHIISQYKQLFMSFAISKIEQSDRFIEAPTKVKPTSESIANYKEISKTFSSDTKSIKEIKEMQKAIKKLGININVDWVWWPKSGLANIKAFELVNILANKYEKDKIDIIFDSSIQQEELSKENSVQKPNTKLDFSKNEEDILNWKKLTDEELDAVFLSKSGTNLPEEPKEWKTTKLETRENTWINEEREDVDEKNFISFLKEFEKMIITEWKTVVVSYQVETQKATGKEPASYETRTMGINKDNYLSLLWKSFEGHLWMERIAKKFWYEDSRSLWTKFTSLSFNHSDEKESLIARVKNVEALDTNNFQSVKNYLFDLNSDWSVSTKLRDALTERSIDDYVKNKNDIKNILVNLWFTWDFSEIKTLSFRDEFADRIVESIKMWPVPFVVLTQEWWYKKFMEKYLENEERLKATIEKSIDNEKLEKSVRKDIENEPNLKKLSKEEKEDKIKEAITVKKAATIAISLGYIKALGVNINIKDLTNWIIDGFNVWINSEWDVWVWINKTLLETSIAGYWLSVSAWLSPSWVWLNAFWSKQLSNEISDSTANITIGWWVWLSFNWSTYTILSAMATNPSVDNVEWINRILTRESKIFDRVMEKLSKWDESFTDEEIKSFYDKSVLLRDLNSEEIKAARANIDDLITKYNTLVKPINNENNKEQLIQKLKKSVLENMVNSLYKWAEWLQVTWIGWFLIPWVVWWVFPILEYNWSTYDVDTNPIWNEVAAEVTRMPLVDFVKKYWEENISINKNSIIIRESSVNLTLPEKWVIKRDLGNWFISLEAEKWSNLTATVGQRYTVEKKENATFKAFDLVIELNWEGEKLQSKPLFNEFPELRKKLDSVESWFNFKTRYNIKWELLNPNASLKERWASLKNLAELWESKKNINYWKNNVPGVWALWKVNLLALIKSVQTEKEQEYVISRISQFLKKSERCDISTNKIKDVIIEDTRRRKAMEKWTFPYSLKEEAIVYYELLKKWKLWSTSQTWLSFDSSSTLVNEKSKKWVDVFKWDAEMITVNDEIVMVEITDTKKIEDLKNRTVKVFAPTEIDTDSLVFYFYKDPYGFDDRVMVSFKPTGWISWNWSSWAVNLNQANHSIWIIPVWTWNEEKLNKPEKPPVTEPIDDTPIDTPPKTLPIDDEPINTKPLGTTPEL